MAVTYRSHRRFVIDRSSVQVRSSAPVFQAHLLWVFFCWTGGYRPSSGAARHRLVSAGRCPRVPSFAGECSKDVAKTGHGSVGSASTVMVKNVPRQVQRRGPPAGRMGPSTTITSTQGGTTYDARRRVTAEIDAQLLDALVTHTPIPGDGIDGLLAYLAARHPTVSVALIEGGSRRSLRCTPSVRGRQATSTCRRPSSCQQTSDDARQHMARASETEVHAATAWTAESVAHHRRAESPARAR